MTISTEANVFIEKARAGRRAALTSLHSRLGQTDKVISIFDNAFPPHLGEPEINTARSAPLRRPTPLKAGLAAA